MNQLEDRIREALASDIDVPELLPDVRRGARRRRARRTTGFGVAAAAAVATVVGVVTYAVGGTGAESPGPAPGTQTQSPTPPEAVPAGVVDVAAGGGLVFALADGRIWRHSETGWDQLHDFDSDRFQYVVAGSDGQNVWAWGDRLWSSHDRGETWQLSDVPANPTYGYHVWPTTDFVWVQTRDRDGLDQYFRSPTSGDEWTRTDAHEGSLLTVGERVAILTYLGEDTSRPELQVSDDQGASWRGLALPCSGENMPYPAATEVFVLCPLGRDGATVYRSVGLARWEEFGTTSGMTKDVEPLTDDALLVVGDRSRILTEAGLSPVEAQLGEGAWDTATAGQTTYLVTQENLLLVSHDGGLTWDPS